MNRISPSRQFALMQSAEKILLDEGLLKLPVDLKSLAKSRDIVIKPINGNCGGVSGMLARHGNTFGILYANLGHSEGFKRFSIAHEFGHYFVDGHIDHIPFENGLHKSRANFTSNNRFEREADFFAAGLLMPRTLILDVIHQQPDGLCAIEAIQSQAETSLTASAIRYTYLTEAAVAVVVSRKLKIEYCFMSETLKSHLNGTWLRKTTPVSTGTVTGSMVNGPRDSSIQITSDVGEVDIVEWFGGTRSLRLREEVVQIGGDGQALTVLTCPELLDQTFMDEDEDSDEALERSWTPNFH